MLERRPQGPEGLLNDPVVAQGAGPGGVLGRRDAEQDERPDAQLAGGPDLVDEPVDAELVVARHGRDLLPDPGPGADEQRQDEVAGVETGLADHVPDERVGPQAAGADNR